MNIRIQHEYAMYLVRELNYGMNWKFQPSYYAKLNARRERRNPNRRQPWFGDKRNAAWKSRFYFKYA